MDPPAFEGFFTAIGIVLHPSGVLAAAKAFYLHKERGLHQSTGPEFQSKFNS
jgi:hypothetical protein